MDNSAPRVVQPEPEKELYKWTAAARPYKARDKQFFTTVVVIVGLIVLILALAQEWMLILTLVAMVFAYYVWSTVPPEEVDYALTNRGIRIANQLHKWEELTRWWTEDQWNYHLLVIEAPVAWAKRLHLVFKDEDEKTVKDIMTKNLLMEKPVVTTMDKMGTWLVEKFPLEMR